MVRLGILILLLLMEFSAIASTFEGLQGRSLLDAVVNLSKPHRYFDKYTGTDGLMIIMAEADSKGMGQYVNRFSDDVLYFPETFDQGAAGVEFISILPKLWWSTSANASSAPIDLYNICPVPAGTGSLKGSLAPGIVDEALYDNGFWKIGFGVFDGEKRKLWQPQVCFSGDFARIMFYMLALYRDGLPSFGLDAALYTSAPSYLGISEAGIRQLLAWHTADPVDEIERRRNNVFSKYQGNRNPFVDNPQLIDFIWGINREKPFEESTPDSPVPLNPIAPQPLKAKYSLNEDFVYLYSPFIPENLNWKIDNIPISDSKVPLSNLGVGIHLLEFYNEDVTGKLLIEVIP